MGSPIEPLIQELLKELGEDPHREGLIKTPERVARAYDFLASGKLRRAPHGIRKNAKGLGSQSASTRSP